MNRNRWHWAYMILGGALAWFLHLMASYAIGEGICVIPGTHFEFFGVTAGGWAILLLSLALAMISGGAAVMGLRFRNDLENLNSFIAQFSLIANGLFTMAILSQAVPVFTLIMDC